MAERLALCDLMICRAGAVTVSELVPAAWRRRWCR